MVIDAQGARQVIAQGQRQTGAAALTIERSADGNTAITLTGQPLWQGKLPLGGGAIPGAPAPDAAGIPGIPGAAPAVPGAPPAVPAL